VKKIKIGDLPEDMQVLLGQMAMDTHGFPMKDDLDFERFKKIKLPLSMIPLEKFPDLPEEPWDYREFERYLHTPIEEFPPVVIAHGMFVDGGHRLWAARKKKAEVFQTINASLVIGKSIKGPGFFTLGPMRE